MPSHSSFFLLRSVLASALWQLGQINDAKAKMVETSYKAKLAAAWREGIATSSVRTLAKAKSTDPAEEQAFDSEMKEVSAQVSKVQEELEGLVSSERGKANLKAVSDQRKVYSAIRIEMFKRKADEGTSMELKAAVSDN